MYRVDIPIRTKIVIVIVIKRPCRLIRGHIGHGKR